MVSLRGVEVVADGPVVGVHGTVGDEVADTDVGGPEGRVQHAADGPPHNRDGSGGTRRRGTTTLVTRPCTPGVRRSVRDVDHLPVVDGDTGGVGGPVVYGVTSADMVVGPLLDHPSRPVSCTLHRECTTE